MQLQIGEILRRKGILSKEEVETVLETQKRDKGLFGSVALSLNLLSRAQLLTALKAQKRKRNRSMGKVIPIEVLKRIFLLFWSVKPSFAFIAVMSVLSVMTGFSTIFPVLIGYGIDWFTLKTNAVSLPAYMLLAILVLCWSVLMQAASKHFSFLFINQRFSALHRRFFKTIYYMHPSDAKGMARGELIDAGVNNIDALKSNILVLVLSISGLIVSLPSFVVLIFYINPVMAIISLLVIVIMTTVPVFISSFSNNAIPRTKYAFGKLTGRISEIVAGSEYIAANHLAKNYTSLILRELKQYFKIYFFSILFYGVSSSIRRLLSNGLKLLVLIGGGVLVLNGTFAVGELIIFYFFVDQISTGVQSVPHTIELLQHAKIQFERMDGLLGMQSRPLLSSEQDTVSIDSITLDNVSFAYDGSSHAVLKNISLDFQSGRIHHVFGPSGSGKTTLIQLIMGFHEPNHGTIHRRYQGNKVHEDSHHLSVSYLSPDPFLFTQESIEFNLHLQESSAISKDQSQKAFDLLTSLGLMNKISSLGKGLKTQLSDPAASFSAGERQRIALARELLRESPLLVLDEPSANLDADSRARVMELVQAQNGRIIVLVSHDPAYQDIADVNYEIKDGHCIRHSDKRKEVYAHS